MNIRLLLLICRVILGAVFIVSGFVKGIDPLGTAYKIDDYFTAFSMPALKTFSVTLSVAQSAAELTLGICLISGILIKFMSRMTFIFMCFFTPFSLWIALTNPVSDCGCFGDAIKLTNWDTFFKNMVLIVLALFLIVKRNHIVIRHNTLSNMGWGVIVVIISLACPVLSLRQLPVLDFRPYSVGTDLYADVYNDAGTDAEELPEIKLIYEKDGVRQNFTINALPDSSWTHIETISSKPVQIANTSFFSVTDYYGYDKTDVILNADYALVFLAEEIERLSVKQKRQALSYFEYADQNGMDFYILTSSHPSEIAEFSSRNPDITIYSADKRTIRTMIRSNPGIMLFGNGVILAKWHENDFPALEWFDQNPVSASIIKWKNNNDFLYCILLCCFVIFISTGYSVSGKIRPKHPTRGLFL